jgi:uncharacterized protein (DUF4415 family)
VSTTAYGVEPGTLAGASIQEIRAERALHIKPALELVREVLGEEASAELRRGRERPPKEDRKVNQTLRIDVDVLEAYRQGGKGW